MRLPRLAWVPSRPGMIRGLRRGLNLACFALAFSLLLSSSNLPPGDRLERIRFYTRAIEFDFLEWTLQALGTKLEQAILDTASYLPAETSPKTVLEYLDLLRQIHALQGQIQDVYADPAIGDPLTASADQRRDLEALKRQRSVIEPVAESILQNQLGIAAAETDLTLGGLTIPPALYHTTPPPSGLIVSPRDTIRQDYNIAISPDLSLEAQVALENQVDQALNVSSLVVGIGGIGLYPTMVMETTDINWLAEVIAHEWIHNYLTLRPLGLNYETSPELRTMNETAAAIAGKELGRRVVERYYPAYLPPPPTPQAKAPAAEEEAEPEEAPTFDYRFEMRQTRVQVDELLSQGQIETAEAYMEQRRQFFWANGYHIRKINQAFFAFHGAYADEEGGPAGIDPVGTAVRLLRQQSPSLRAFINRIAWMVSFEQLQSSVNQSMPAPDAP